MRLLIFFLALSLSVLAPASATLENRLQQHPSPYLAMHGDDPVAWQDWAKPVLEAAAAADKLVFISSGYFACHWCHVMQRESYQNPEIAKLLNEHFVPVKLDRELHPALDAHLIDFVQQTQGRAGWPLNVFLTPEGHPLFGLTYAPPERFAGILKRLVTLWSDERTSTRDLALRASVALRKAGEASAPEVLVMSPNDLRQRLSAAALGMADDMSGGFGSQSRFPMAPQLLALLQAQAVVGNSEQGDFLILTLDQMMNEGLRDHLAGGFYRYTVDPGWQVPHYEKMLYTQALLARVFLHAAEVFEREDYARVAAHTLDFALRDMTAQGGAYIASLSAVDGDGVEGGSYLWTAEQLRAVLGEADAKLAAGYWQMQGTAATDGGYLPRLQPDLKAVASVQGLSQEALSARIAALSAKLMQSRAERSLPRDTKVLAGWNGLLLGALAQAGVQLERPDFIQAAHTLADYLLTTLWDGEDLLRARDGEGRALGEASLEDYAYLAQGLDLMTGVPGGERYAAMRDRLLQLAWTRFYSPESGWRSGVGATRLPAMVDHVAMGDGPMPSPTALVVALSLRPGQPEARQQQARRAQRAARSVTQDDPFWHATAVAVMTQPESGVAHPGAVGQ